MAGQNKAMGERQVTVIKRWFRPLLLVSISLHGLLLVLPISGPDIPEAENLESDSSLANPLPAAMEVTTLPVVAPLPTASPVSAAIATGQPPTTGSPQSVAQAPPLPVTPPDPNTVTPEHTSEIEDSSPDTPAADETAFQPDSTINPPVTSAPPSETPPVYSGTGTSANDANVAYWSWSQRIIESFEVQPSQSQAPFTLTATASECREPAPQTASIGIVADANGALLDEPELLKSSGWTDLNDQVLDQAKQQVYATDGVVKSIFFEVEIHYENGVCTASNTREAGQS